MKIRFVKSNANLGTATITYYAVSVMETSGSSLDKYTATIIYGVIRLIASSFGALLMRRFARRPLLIISSVCVSLGMIMLGYATYYNNVDDEERNTTVAMSLNTNTTNDLDYVESKDVKSGFVANYLPLLSVNFIAVSYQFGLGPVGWAYTGYTCTSPILPYRFSLIAELFPVDMRAFLSGFCNFATNFYIFLVLKTFSSCKSEQNDISMELF